MKNVRLMLIAIAAVWILGFMQVQAQNPQFAQDKSANIITRSIDVKNADVTRIADILYAIAKATGTTSGSPISRTSSLFSPAIRSGLPRWKA